ncbi:MAG: hypothetical protein Q9227_003749 [Pyrenula ochraceoflavens]
MRPTINPLSGRNSHPVPTDDSVEYEFVAAEDEQQCVQLPLYRAINSVYPDSPYPSIDRTSHKCFIQLQTWYSKCTRDHRKCVRQIKPLPSRLLQIRRESPSSAHVLLFNTSPSKIANKKTPYVALSYCWGGVSHFSTTKSNILARFNHGISFNDLPPVVRDAVEVTEILGVRFLWVDALCICQDDKEDWEKEANRMSDVYEGCALTISALSNKNVKTSFLRDRNFQQPIALGDLKTDHVYCTRSSSKLFIRRVPRSGTKELTASPLSKRAWPLQERVLSPAVLHYGRDQMVWECNEWFCAETGEFERTPHPRDGKPGSLDRIPVSPSRKDDSVEVWPRIIEEFTARNITFPSDRLPAILGIASKLRRTTTCEGRYAAGHWENGLEFDLLWKVSVENGSSNQSPKQINYEFPTWSWAYSNQRVDYKFVLLQRKNLKSALSNTPRFRFADRQEELQSRQSGTTISTCAVELGGYVQDYNPNAYDPGPGGVFDKNSPAPGPGMAFKPFLRNFVCYFDCYPPPDAPYYCLRMVHTPKEHAPYGRFIFYLVLCKAQDCGSLLPINTYNAFNAYIRVGWLMLNAGVRNQDFKKPYPDVFDKIEDYSNTFAGEIEPALSRGRWENVVLI